MKHFTEIYLPTINQIVTVRVRYYFLSFILSLLSILVSVFGPFFMIFRLFHMETLDLRIP